jgi:hypothetical protein
MSGFYLTLNQGVGKTADDPPNKARLVQLHRKAVVLRGTFSSLSLKGFTLDDSSLSDNRTGKAYEVATIAYKYYPVNRIPADQLIVDDLTNLLEVYQSYVESL